MLNLYETVSSGEEMNEFNLAQMKTTMVRILISKILMKYPDNHEFDGDSEHSRQVNFAS